MLCTTCGMVEAPSWLRGQLWNSLFPWWVSPRMIQCPLHVYFVYVYFMPDLGEYFVMEEGLIKVMTAMKDSLLNSSR